MAVSPYISAPNILTLPEAVIRPVAVSYGARKTLKAGMPISANGAVANDSTAIGVLLTDVHKELGQTRGQVVVMGFIDTTVAQSHSGITITDDAKAAMKNVVFSGDVGRGILPEISEGDEGKAVVAGAAGFELTFPSYPAEGILVHSSTAESEKIFAITVDDDGEITATEVTEDTGDSE